MYPTVTRVTGDLVTALGPQDIDQLPWQPVPDCPGVWQKVVWQSGAGADALLRYDPGASTPGVPHLGAEHHIWMVDGEASVAGRPLAAGSYAYVPVGAAHPIRNSGGATCLLLQIHRAARYAG